MMNDTVRHARAHDSRENRRNAEWTKTSVRDSLSRQRSRYMNLDETYRPPSLFTWRC